MKLPQAKPAKVVRFLLKHEFIETHQTGSHRHFHHPDCHRTQVSMHPKTLAKGTLHAIIKQSGIPREIFLKFL